MTRVAHRQAILRRILALWLLFSMIFAQLAPATASAQITPRGDVASSVSSSTDDTGGLTMLLSDGAEQPVAAVPVAPVTGQPLTESELQTVLSRLPVLETAAGDVVDFRLPSQSPRPPLTGATVAETFPPTQTVAAPTVDLTGPLEVLRVAPEGEIPLAPFLNITFNQPMVPLATLEQLSAADVPVTLTPDIPGVWKWLGAKTLTFEYKGGEIDRFPMATEFTATVPAGTKSISGATLAESVTWQFRTPPPTIVNQYPIYGPQRRDTLFFLQFNQRIDAAAMLAHVRVTAQNVDYAIRAATTEEVGADRTVSQYVQNAPDARWLAFKTLDLLPADTTVNVIVDSGAPSAEGPLTTETPQAFSFQTFAPLRIVEHRCDYYDGPCPPLTPFSIRFNNPLDATLFDPALFTVEPAVPGLVVDLFGDTVMLTGATAGRTDYTVTIAGAVTDQFGQTLGEDAKLTFRTTDAPGMLTGPDRFVTLDPAAPAPLFTVYTVNYNKLRVRAFAVTPDDWSAYLEFQNQHRYANNMPDPPGRQVWSKTVSVQGEQDQLAETAVDLSPALAESGGPVIVVVDAPSLLRLFGLGENPQRVVAWVQQTHIGLDAFSDYGKLVVWATDLRNGKPLPDVNIELFQTGIKGMTDADGVAELALGDKGSSLLIGKLGDDQAILADEGYYDGSEGRWARRPVTDELRWYVFDDRQMYRPGEEVHVKGWLRQVGNTQTGDVGLPQATGLSVRYQLVDAFGNELANAVTDVNDLAGFDFVVSVPENANLGYASLYLTAQGVPAFDGQSYGHSIQIQEFRRPEFEVTAAVEGKGPFFVGDEVTAAVTAAYFAGGPLPNAEASWTVTATPGQYSPPNWPEFVFGKWLPWWGYLWESAGSAGYEGANTETFTGRTDATGVHYLNMNFVAAAEPQPYSVTAGAAVMDVNRQVWNSSTNLLIHPSTRYVGLRSERTFVNQGEPLEVDAIVTDVDGNALPDVAIELRAARLQWESINGNWSEEEADVQECTVTSSAAPVRCTFTTELGGTYRISATVLDERERANRSELTRWVSGGQRPPARTVEQEQVLLIPDKENYQPGDEANILVQAPFAPAEGLLTVSRNGILYTEPFRVEEGSTVLHIPIEDGYTPSVDIQVNLNGSAPRVDDQGVALDNALPRPAFAVGNLQLAIPPVNRTLSVAVQPAADELAPGATTAIDLHLTDAAGNPVEDGEIAVVVVDEAILALTGYRPANPLDIFYQPRYSGVDSLYARRFIVLDNPQRMLEKLAAGGHMLLSGEGGAMMPMAAAAPASVADMMVVEESMQRDSSSSTANGNAPSIQVRSNFDPLALFAPAQRTDADGHTRVEFTLPDNLTRYRIIAVAAADGKYFGSGEANLTARLPLMVRPSAPRFLNFGDRFDLPVVLQNQTGEPLAVDVAVQATNLELTDLQGQRVTVPANDRVEVRFPMATANAGTARLRIAAVSGAYADAADGQLPVYTPATTEAFATYGVLDEGSMLQPLATPRNVFPQFGGLEINTSSTALQALTDAVLYLVDYPYSCSEQIASRVLGIAALRDVLTAFNAQGLPAPAELEAAVQRDIAALQGMQNEDGGFPIWERGRRSEPFYSVHAAHALQRAKEKGFAVPADTLARALDYVRAVDGYIPPWYGIQSRHMLNSYAVYVRFLMGDVDLGRAAGLFAQMPPAEQSLEAVAWLWQVLGSDPAYATQVDEIRRLITNRAVETAGAANFTTSYGEDAYLLLHSNRRTDALILDALISNQPESDLIPKVVNGLLGHRTRGRWENTQENVFVLLALDHYFNTFEATTPDFVARVWLGDTYVAEHEFRGRTTERRETTVPMRYLTDNAADLLDLAMTKEGAGRLYYRLGLRYAPDDLVLDPLDRGFLVERTYSAVDDPADVTRDAEGVWHVRAGARVRVTLKMVADNRRYHVALVDPLPAGLEIINPALAVSEEAPAAPANSERYGWWWWGTWYEHQNLRDQRAEAFTSLLWDGVYDYSYVARATTPGVFVVPPAKAEEMYAPEVFGRSASDRVIVE